MQGVEVMGRKRSTNKHIPMSLSIPHSLVIRVDKELSYKQSRSKWVQGAIKAKLDEVGSLDNIELSRIIQHVYEHLSEDGTRRTIRELYVKGVSQFVETEE